ncbi:DUF1569 domain-containing protein [Shewanella olleyana]|uniref:DUF1569 domain-containing protein n=1 Tax=Shewanella olleyana TaxID=135626 RepID=UPI00200CCD12|nr:DUF1569 domain-containing protein [Shewanella olleyana]MCL1065593.1 DUF1569 domain-containing protein [Shewanella olleyana]
MNRRVFLKTLLAGGTISTAAVGITWFSIDMETQPLTIKHTLTKLAKIKQQLLAMTNTEDLISFTTGKWDLNQIFNHCAQSVEYSMTGYPEHKSEVFKQTVGTLAFSAFAAKGKMKHNLSEAIPGAPALLETKPLSTEYILTALSRFTTSLTDFESYTGKLQPHFAYGELSKQEYTLAHAMHFNNHLLELIVE